MQCFPWLDFGLFQADARKWAVTMTYQPVPEGESGPPGPTAVYSRMSLKRVPWLRMLGTLTPFLAALAAFVVGGIMLFAMGVSPVEAYAALIQGAFGSVNSIIDTIIKSVPLIFVAVGICVAFRGGVFNIGVEGQMILGGLGASALIIALPTLPAWALIPLALLAGFLAGGLWGAIPGALKAYLGVNEILTTIMMNEIAVQLMNFLLRGPMIDPAQIQRKSYVPQTIRFPMAADLPRLVPTRLHAGVILAVVAAVLVWLLLWRTSLGFRIRVVGLNVWAARRSGIRVERHILLAMLISGALAGLAGAVQVMGVHHLMYTDATATGFTVGAGFNGIVAALFGQLNPLGAIPASLLFGGLLVGSNTMQRAVQVPTAFVTALNGLVVIFVVSSEIFRRRLARRQELLETARTEKAPEIRQEVKPT